MASSGALNASGAGSTHVPAFRTYERNKKGRLFWLTPDKWAELMDRLPRHTKLMALFSLATGLRQGNVRRLLKSDIDWERRVAYVGRQHNPTKNRKLLTVPLNRYALIALKGIWNDCPNSPYVFTYRGKPIKQVNTRAWRRALREIGIDNLRWHDLRHTWASWLRQRGVPTWALRELAGWKSPSMAERYAHVSVDHLRRGHGHNLSTISDRKMAS